MSAIGYVTRNGDGFKGQLKTLSIRTDIEIVPNARKSHDRQPDYRVMANGVEVGAAWNRRSETTGNDYVSLSLAAPEFGPRRLYAHLVRAAAQDDDDASAIIWNPADRRRSGSTARHRSRECRSNGGTLFKRVRFIPTPRLQ